MIVNGILLGVMTPCRILIISLDYHFCLKNNKNVLTSACCFGWTRQVYLETKKSKMEGPEAGDASKTEIPTNQDPALLTTAFYLGLSFDMYFFFR